VQERGSFAGGEPQLGRAQLGELAFDPQPRQRERRVRPGGQHKMQARRPVFQQERN
jgi:hypothetical protein